MSEYVVSNTWDPFPNEENTLSVYCVDEGRFARKVAQLYERSSAPERATILNRLLRAVTAGSTASDIWTPITEAETATLPRDAVEDIANESARRDARVLSMFS